MKKLVKGALASSNEIATKVNEIVEWINRREDNEEDKTSK